MVSIRPAVISSLSRTLRESTPDARSTRRIPRARRSRQRHRGVEGKERRCDTRLYTDAAPRAGGSARRAAEPGETIHSYRRIAWRDVWLLDRDLDFRLLAPRRWRQADRILGAVHHFRFRGDGANRRTVDRRRIADSS